MCKLEINYDNLCEDSRNQILDAKRKKKPLAILNGKHRLTHRHFGQRTVHTHTQTPHTLVQLNIL